ncbi:hypothetical protein FSZ31_11280 [Sphingorhabdus soli]|uniref:Uncharacterized protein n=1 Tax=Flavisphingopyxis soli TaxID=2601267 RepID=A0A5C6U762_9SPHN|nr:hypothetical protein [Sphingorhabdus soli]TXC68260.1 hypothetical protein FSZ31_11280 [Sphingorhabdus soli]
MALLLMIVKKEAVMLKVMPNSEKHSVSVRPRKRFIVSTSSVDARIDTIIPPARSRKASFRKSDVWRAISAAQKGGVAVSEMEIGNDGSIRLKFVGVHPDTGEQASDNEFDKWSDKL